MKVTVKNTRTGKIQVWRGEQAVRRLRIAFYRTQTRQATIRLTPTQRRALEDALSPHSPTTAMIERIEDALWSFEADRKTRRTYDEKRLLRAQQKRLSAAQALQPHLGALGETLEKPLQRFIDRLSQHVEELNRETHRPTDTARRAPRPESGVGAG